MPNLRKLHEDKIKLAAKVLFELPPSDTLPVFKRLSIDGVRKLLDQIKDKPPKGRELSDQDLSLLKPPVVSSTRASDTNDHYIDDCQHAKKTAEQTNGSLAGMKRFATLTDDQIKAVLKHSDTSFWAPALKNAPASIQQKIMSCMAPAAVGLLKIEIDKLGDVNQRDEKLARERIIHTAFRLATNVHNTPQSRIHESEAA